MQTCNIQIMKYENLKASPDSKQMSQNLKSFRMFVYVRRF